ncbi:MAG TPA: hypothetical protein VE133_13435 [Candidatus Sulfotelmatobacter sp.]|nr:hypothetical protein [Candidatus Sulfotelmatobacter sp.]
MAQLSAHINESPQGLSQRALTAQMQTSAVARKQSKMAEWMNPAVAAQAELADVSSDSPVQRECAECGLLEDEHAAQRKVAQRVNYATASTVEAITEAYPILGTKLGKAYEKIDHNPNTDKKRVASYRARITVMKLFRQAHLCNGINGAPKRIMDSFLSEEDGHITAANNLYLAMGVGSQALFNQDCTTEIRGVSTTKKQCK